MLLAKEEDVERGWRFSHVCIMEEILSLFYSLKIQVFFRQKVKSKRKALICMY